MDGWKLIQEIRDGWPSVRAAKWVVFSALILGIIAGCAGTTFWWSGTVSALRERLNLAAEQRDNYKDKLGGATPEEAKAKIDKLERVIQTVVGSKWAPLTKSEVQALAARLSAMQPRFTNIIYENQLGKDLAQTLLEAFKQAGWSEVGASSGTGAGLGITVGHGNGLALKIKDAIETSTKLRVASQSADENDGPGTNILISVGINQN